MTLTDTNVPILAIDPGNERSGWVVYDGVDVLKCGIWPNEQLLQAIDGGIGVNSAHLAIEMVASYGMPVGRTVFDTCVWIGEFKNAFGRNNATLVYRKDVKMHLCGTMRAKDSNIRQAIMDRYGSTRRVVLGTKKDPGPLYGMTGDMWAALGVALTFWETRGA